MKTLFLPGILFFLFSLNLSGQQTFIKSFGVPDYCGGNSIVQTDDGGYMVAGYKDRPSVGDNFFLLRLDENGDSLWTLYNDSNEAFGLAKSGEKYVAAGYKHIATGSRPECDIALVCANEEGDILWTNEFGGPNIEFVQDIQPITGGGYILCGYFDGKFNDTFNSRVFLAKVTPHGDSLWLKIYEHGDKGNARAKKVRQTIDGGYIICGDVSDETSDGKSTYIFVVRTDAIGDTLWTAKFDWPGSDVGYSVCLTNSGCFLISGITNSMGNGIFDIILMEIDDTGRLIWKKTYGGEEDDRIYSAECTKDGGYILAGWTSGFGSEYFDIFLIRTNHHGDTLWTKTYGGINQEEAFDVKETSDGGFVMVGYSRSYINEIKPGGIIVIKTDSSGNITKTATINADTPSEDGFKIYPNPSCNNVNISFNMPYTGEVDACIYTSDGRLICTLLHSRMQAGSHTLVWGGKDNDNHLVPGGLYFVQIRCTGFIYSKKIILQR